MNPRFLTTPWQRSSGAMFKRSLDDTSLVFVYPHPAPRIFHTFFCPPLRLLALGNSGEVLWDQIVAPNRFVRLPAAQIVVEVDPTYNLSQSDLHNLVLRAAKIQPLSGAWQVTTSIDRLLFALLRGAVADLRRVHEAHGRNGKVSSKVLKEKFAPWERGQLTNSAGFLLNWSDMCEIPETALCLSHQLLAAEADNLAEITAASIAGTPWQGDFPTCCLRCGKTASWRPVFSTPKGPPEMCLWRYERPENHVPLCRRCSGWLGWKDRVRLRVDLARCLWGSRFDAFRRWHRQCRTGQLPTGWDRDLYPLWPQAFGDDTWEGGSGALVHADPRPPAGVARTTAHRAALARVLNGKGGVNGKRGRGTFLPWQPLLEWAEIPAVELI